LHGFRLAIFPGPGCRVEIICPDAQQLKAIGKAADPAREAYAGMADSSKAAMATAAKSI
jgi:hypothetical protein